MRRIVHYYPGAMGDSGVTATLWGWARAQAASGHEVSVLHAPADEPTGDVSFVSKEECRGLSIQCVPHRGRHRMTRRPVGLGRYLGRNDLLVLHEGWVPSNWIAAATARRAGVPYMVIPHGVYDAQWMTYLKPPMAVRRYFERQFLEGAAAINVNYESEKADISALAPRAAFLTVPAGLELPSIQWTGGGGYLAWIGRVDPVHKGLDLLAGGMARLSPAERPLLRIHGYDYKGGVARLRQLIDQLNVGKWVQINGLIAGSDKTRFLQEADGYIHPSRWECHSVALLENLALGVPCIVSDVIHIAKTLARTGAAILAAPTEIGLAAALGRLPKESEVGQRGRALMNDVFSWPAVMPQFQAAIGRLGLQ